MLIEESGSLDSPSQPDEVAPVGDGVKIDVLDLLMELAMRRRTILTIALVTGVIVACAALLLKNTYVSTVVIMPPRQNQSVSSLLSGQIGALNALGGGSLGASLSLKNPNEIFSGMLMSRTIATALVDRFNLKEVFREKTTEDAINNLASHTTIDLSKDSLIRISVSTHDPNFSSQLANAYVDELHEMNTNLALTESSQRRYFFQQQLDGEKVMLAEAESSLRETQKRTGMMQPTGQADMVARNISSVRSEITVREAELQSLNAFATKENPDYIRLNAQIASLQHELQELERGQKKFTPGDIEVPTAQLPESSLEYARKLREVRLHEELYGLLVKQFEAAKIDEAKTAPIIQIVDKAIPAQHKSGPPRLIISFVSALLALLFSTSWFIAKYIFGVLAQYPPIASSLSRLGSK